MLRQYNSIHPLKIIPLSITGRRDSSPAPQLLPKLGLSFSDFCQTGPSVAHPLREAPGPLASPQPAGVGTNQKWDQDSGECERPLGALNGFLPLALRMESGGIVRVVDWK